MKKLINRLNAFFKGVSILFHPYIYLGWLRRPLQLFLNMLSMSKWAAENRISASLNDFYSPLRDYQKRYQLYEHLLNSEQLRECALDYLEFGVSGGYSFKWWVAANVNSDSRFYGFDTFEGLPEGWGTYNRGDMAAPIPGIDDTRALFYKGLFQDTLPAFLKTDSINNRKLKIIHLDADLFSSTLFALTSLAPWLKKGDILLFDEFNVPNHEFAAFKIFSDSYYVKTKLLAAVNNYYQVAMQIV
ncbi:MAG: class I SAM-dependent methyltransferase [Bacteroidetes bacterium]|nr:class I SAM-dependent methyltransferase [Bacteroidota bacterium]